MCHIEKVDGLTIEVVPAKLEFKNEGDVQSFELDYIHYLNDRKFDFVQLKSESNDAIIKDICDLAMNEKNTVVPAKLEFKNEGG